MALSVLERDYQYYSTALSYNFSWSLSTVPVLHWRKLNYYYTTNSSSSPIVRPQKALICSYDTSAASLGVVNTFYLMDETTSFTSKTLNKVAATNGT
ncbi:MAG: hypothetical protein QM734_02530 [Cyclobacteriaceae bacterium]